MSVALATNSIVNLGPQYTKLLKSPNMKKFLCALWGIALALTYVGCSSDDREENGGDGGSTDYIVTKDLKQRTFANDVTAHNQFNDNTHRYYHLTLEGNIIYEDFNVRYRLAGEAGEFRLKYYQRENGKFNTLNNSISEKAGIIEVPDISSIEEISESYKNKNDILANSSVHSWKAFLSGSYSMAYAAFQPGCGYVIMLTTGPGEEIYIRMRATNYTLDDESALETVTLEYQLF